MGIEEQFENRNIQSIIKYNRKVEAVLNQASKDLARKISIFELKNPSIISQGSFYKINRALEKKVNTILGKLHADIQANIGDGVVSNWDMANLKNNKLVGNWAEGIKLSKDGIPTSFNQLNLVALDTFLTRTEAGMNISERVWNLTNGAKDQIELYLASGISTGESAAGIAGDIKQYLNEPNRLFRRVRREGRLVLSKAARGYHPGAGIYRSSYRNALRLAKNEINMAYRMSDYTRRQQLPFVTGIEVHLSASHPRLDMCDDLVGKYPKGFIFMTWHVGCLCYTTSIMLNKKDSLKFMETGKIDESKYISKIPKRAGNWIKANSSKIAGYKNVPYFIKDNFTKDFKLKENVTRISMPVSVPAGVPIVPKWKPIMTAKEAEVWAKDSRIQETIFHGTSMSKANKIKEAGFALRQKAIGGKFLGDGVYVTSDKKMAKGFASAAKELGIGKAKTLSLKVNIKNPYTFQNYADGDRFFTFLDRENIPSIDIPKFLKSLGYDALDAREFSPDFGINIFNPKNITVIKGE